MLSLVTALFLASPQEHNHPPGQHNHPPGEHNHPPETPATGTVPTAGNVVPSDPAALGFLDGVVEPRVYTLEGAGAQRVEAQASISFQGVGPRPPEMKAQVVRDFVTNEVSLDVIEGEPRAEAEYALGLFANQLLFVATPKASGVERHFRVSLHQEDEGVVRLQYEPRMEGLGYAPYQEWFQADGTPLRRSIQTPPGPQSPGGNLEMVLKYEERDGELLLSSQTMKAGGMSVEQRFEYARQNGYWTLRRMEHQTTQFLLTIEYTAQVTPAR